MITYMIIRIRQTKETKFALELLLEQEKYDLFIAVRRAHRNQVLNRWEMIVDSPPYFSYFSGPIIKISDGI